MQTVRCGDHVRTDAPAGFGAGVVKAVQHLGRSGAEVGGEAAQHRDTGRDQGVVPFDGSLVIARGQMELVRVDLPGQTDVGEPDVDAGQEGAVRAVEPRVGLSDYRCNWSDTPSPARREEQS